MTWRWRQWRWRISVRQNVVLVNPLLPGVNMKPNQAKRVLSELIPIFSEQQTLGRGSGRPVTVAEFNGVWREENLKDASLVLLPRWYLASCSCRLESDAAAASRGGYLPPKIIKLSLRNLKSFANGFLFTLAQPCDLEVGQIMSPKIT